MRVLVLNAGSTSAKVALFEGPPEAPVRRWSLPWPGERELLAQIGGEVDWATVTAVGHRVVHGGEHRVDPCALSDTVLAELRALTPYDPAHLPRQIALIEELMRARPGVRQVACFDTAFHARLPAVSRMLALPRRLLRAGVRRYGFHGLSYQGALLELERRWGREAARGRLVLAHLGGGASLAAVRDGASIDTTMGFSPAAGIAMGTRSGDVDPGVIAYLARTEAMGAEAFVRMANEESGLLGISEISGDLRTLCERAPGDPRAEEAVGLFCYQVKKQIGAYAAALGGIDRLVFTGGAGERGAGVRARVCEGLGFLGITLDGTRNEAHAPVISAPGAAVSVEVVAADEERVIWRAVRDVVTQKGEGGPHA